MRFRKQITAIVGVAAIPFMLASGAQGKDYKAAQPLLTTTKTNIGQKLQYPKGQSKVVSLIVTLQPGEATGRHTHPVPTYGHILEGEVTVDYGTGGKKVYRTGDTFVEAVNHWHDGRNTGTVPCRILVVFIGAEGVPNVMRPKK